MNLRSFFLTLVLGLWGILFATPIRAAEAPLTEHAKIEALINHLAALHDATFIRNGSEYQSKNAVKFLRGKWDSNKKDIHTAKDFIDKAATKSSTTGKPYLIRLKGAASMNCADYLNAQLKIIEAAKG
jgi:Family of unknown function (DUF5329)